jgi:hypothetical protein
MTEEPGGFLSRWSRRKVQARTDEAPAATVEPTPALATPVPGAVPVAAVATLAVDADAATPVVPTAPSVAGPSTDAAAPPPALSLADVAALGRDSDFSAFVAHGVAPDVKNAALKKLFTDPHFNVMDGLDTYIDDYGKPDPLPPGMLRQMVQSKMLALFDDEPETDADADAEAAAQPEPGTGHEPGPPPDTTAAPACPEHPALPPGPTDHEDPAVQLQPDHDAGCAGLAPGAVAPAGRPD